MIIKDILIGLTSLAALAWLLRRIAIGHSGRKTNTRASVGPTGQAGQGSNPPEKKGEDSGEITDSMAAEIVATWNLLNPP